MQTDDTIRGSTRVVQNGILSHHENAYVAAHTAARRKNPFQLSICHAISVDQNWERLSIVSGYGNSGLQYRLLHCILSGHIS